MTLHFTLPLIEMNGLPLSRAQPEAAASDGEAQVAAVWDGEVQVAAVQEWAVERQLPRRRGTPPLLSLLEA